jgi:signal transduction histidine kinase
MMPVEFECSRKDGSRFVATCVITPLQTGGLHQWLAVLNDVTERKRLERQLIEIANREQQRIGSDLHDGLGQDLTGIALLLKGVAAQLRKEGSAARADVEDVIELVNTAIDSTRMLARGLSPVSGEPDGLSAALKALASQASQRAGKRVEFQTNFDEPLRLGEATATHVYRIVQEAITNVIRHSRATKVLVRLETMDGELHLRVEDNGQGFARSPHDSGGGLGLKIMRYRAQMLGGDLVLESGAMGGASVRCSWPLDGAVPTKRDSVSAQSPSAAVKP